MKIICVNRLFGLLCSLNYINNISNKFDTVYAINNIYDICEEIPYW